MILTLPPKRLSHIIICDEVPGRLAELPGKTALSSYYYFYIPVKSSTYI